MLSCSFRVAEAKESEVRFSFEGDERCHARFLAGVAMVLTFFKEFPANLLES